MAISSTNSRNDYIGNGATKVFAYVFRIFKKEDLRITIRDTVGVETLLTLDIDYSVQSVGEPAGGTITLIDSGQSWLTGGFLIIAYVITVRRVVDLKQETDIRNQGDFFPETHEDQFDRHTMADQQQQDELDRAMKNPETVPVTDFDPTLPANIATPNRQLVTNSAGDGLVLGLGGADAERLFSSKTYAALKLVAVGDPTTQRWGWATDIKQLVFYTADLSVGDAGWIVVGG